MFKYIGPGFIEGIPARDLTDEEAEAYGVESSPLYEKQDVAVEPAAEPAVESAPKPRKPQKDGE